MPGWPSYLRSAIEFLTPLGHATRAPASQSLAWFPLAGAMIGAGEGIAWRAIARRTEPLLAAAVTVVVDAAITGGLHLDGLADTADGCFAHVPARDRLAIMEGAELGAFGTTALSLALLTRTAALASCRPSVGLCAALCGASRSLMAGATQALPYAREHGIVSVFLSGPARGVVLAWAVVGMAGAVVLAGATNGRRGVRSVLVGAAGGALVLAGAHRRLGGYTGDVLGAAGVVCETTGLIAAAWCR